MMVKCAAAKKALAGGKVRRQASGKYASHSTKHTSPLLLLFCSRGQDKDDLLRNVGVDDARVEVAVDPDAVPDALGKRAKRQRGQHPPSPAPDALEGEYDGQETVDWWVMMGIASAELGTRTSPRPRVRVRIRVRCHVPMQNTMPPASAGWYPYGPHRLTRASASASEVLRLALLVLEPGSAAVARTASVMSSTAVGAIVASGGGMQRDVIAMRRR